jgi:hypothetical protein
MTTNFGSLTIGASAQHIVATLTKGTKLFIQSAPGNTGNVKIGGSSTITSDNTTPGVFLSASADTNADGSKQAGATWSVESHDVNTIEFSAYWVHGTHAGDIVMWETHTN